MGEGVEAFILSYSYKKKAKTHILSSRRKVGHVELQVLVAFSRGRRCCRWAALHIVKVRAAVLSRAKDIKSMILINFGPCQVLKFNSFICLGHLVEE